MIIALSRFTIANGMADKTRASFGDLPHLVDAADGFLGMEVMSPFEKPAEIWLLTRWADEPSYRNWHRGHTYYEAHKGIPKGLAGSLKRRGDAAGDIRRLTRSGP